MLTIEDFDYPLPKALIAQFPLARRDAARLLVADRASGALLDRQFTDILDIIPAGDVLVINDTRVFQARLAGRKKKTQGKVEILLLEGQPVESSADTGGARQVYRCLVRPALHAGQEILLEPNGLGPAAAVYLEKDRDGAALVEFTTLTDVRQFCRQAGTIPLPPYIKRQPDAQDAVSYQTVYAAREGAVAAPTAGLHFTDDLLDQLLKKGVQLVRVTLHVGYGTFRPVADLENHRMMPEAFELTRAAADALNRARAEKRQIWAVGSTSLRVLESCVQHRRIIPGSGRTDLFVKEPFTFEAADHLLTNFHLPKTTLVVLVSAFMGEALRRKAYAHAVEQSYRFYSYGDAMLIL